MTAHRPAGSGARGRRPLLAASVATMFPTLAWTLTSQVALTYCTTVAVTLLTGWPFGADRPGTALATLTVAAATLLILLIVPLPDTFVAAVLARGGAARAVETVKHLTSPGVTAVLGAACAGREHPDPTRLARALRTRAALEAYTATLAGQHLPNSTIQVLLTHPAADRASRGALPLHSVHFTDRAIYLPDVTEQAWTRATLMTCVHVSIDEGLDALAHLADRPGVALLAVDAARRCVDLTDPTRLNGPARAALLHQVVIRVSDMGAAGQAVLRVMLDDGRANRRRDIWQLFDYDDRCTCSCGIDLLDLLTAADAAGADPAAGRTGT